MIYGVEDKDKGWSKLLPLFSLTADQESHLHVVSPSTRGPKVLPADHPPNDSARRRRGGRLIVSSQPSTPGCTLAWRASSREGGPTLDLPLAI
ncbi:hypothetical protein TNCV_3324031 [Trichonephila clavipes]|nr:hypothetical protein TNCV_3324031 [Trichonephila clavipes]